jgi:hypothetical protein
MRRSQQVAAPLLASAAVALLTACRSPQMQRCVDESGVVAPDSFCQNQPLDQHNGNTYYHPFGSGGYYRWYYGGGGGYSPGTIVGGGGYTPVAGSSYATSTMRGGFGSTHAGGGGADE